MNKWRIPLVDLARQYKLLKNEVDRAVFSVMKESAFILGPYTKKFEESFAKYVGTKHCIGVNSGTDALFLAYEALGIREGDEVIAPANTYFATTEPLYFLSARPVFADINPNTHLIDPMDIKRKITKRTKAITVVHLYGNMAPMDEIRGIAKKHKLFVIEDAAQAHGATYRGKRAGNFSDVCAYSFYPGKNLGAYGDAGAVATNSDKLMERIRKYRDHGRMDKYAHEFPAMSSRMDGIQAAVLSVKLKHLDKWVKRRRVIASWYNQLLSPNVTRVMPSSDSEHSYHLYVIESDNRDELLDYMRAKGIEVGIHYPIPLHLQKAYKFLNVSKGLLPNTERAASRILSLPVFPEMTLQEVKKVVQCVSDFFDKFGK